jgi:hypothetical protein
MDGIRALEAYFAKRKPGMIGRFSLSFGIPHLLAKDPMDPKTFFGDLLETANVADREWVRWNRAFSMLQLKEKAEAKGELVSLLDSRPDPVLHLLTLYLMDVLAKDDGALGKRVAEGRDGLRGRFTQEQFGRRIEAAAGNMEVVVLSRLLQDALRWLFAGPPSAGQPSEEPGVR